MIPKIIHYCWFGRNPLPESAQKCIASWRKFLPDYEIWQWSEEPLNENENANENLNANKLEDKVLAFDVNSIRYTKEAYEAKKYAFVSDYARFWILYHYGGLYFDTDVEVIRSFDDIVERGPFMGIEAFNKEKKYPLINPGLGLGAEAEMSFYKDALDFYSTLRFLNDNGTLNQKTIVEYTTKLFLKKGIKVTGEIQKVADIWIYPQDYFNPYDDIRGRLRCTDNTYSIHWYSKTWLTVSPMRMWLSRMSHRIFGTKLNEMRMKLKSKI